MAQDSTTTIRASASRFFSGTLFSRVLGATRDITMAAAFGSHPTIAALFMAFRFANLPRRLLAEGAMQSAVVPTFEALRQQDPGRARAFARDLMATLVLVALLVVAIGRWLFVGRGEVLTLTAWMLPSLIFIALFGINTAILNCERRYFLPSAAPGVLNLLWIGGVLLLWGRSPESAVFPLAMILVCGFAAQWLLTLPGTLYALKGTNWLKPRPFSFDVRRLARPLILGILGVGAQQINSAVDAVFARIADPSGPFYLWYALRLQQLPLALFGLALSTALLPPLARAARDPERFGELLLFALQRALALMIPCTLGVFALGLPAVDLLYHHGAFTQPAVVITTHCLYAYAFGLVPAAVAFILAGACYARGDYRTPAVISALTVGLNLLLNGVLILGFRLGPEAVALATAASSWLHALTLVTILKRRNFFPTLKPAVRAGLRALACSVVAWITVVGLRTLLGGDSPGLIGQIQTFCWQAGLFGALWWSLKAVKLRF